MRKLIAAEFVTIDGVVESSEMWQPQYVTEDVAGAIQASILSSDAMLLGRVTYSMFASYWPLQKANEFGIAEKINQQRKYVVSSTLKEADWNGTIILSGDVVNSVRGIKHEAGGDIRLCGSPTLVDQLMSANLIDETWLLVHPVIMGRGRRVFTDISGRNDFRLLECRAFQSGVVLLRHERLAPS